jgi:hypothetical protein
LASHDFPVSSGRIEPVCSHAIAAGGKAPDDLAPRTRTRLQKPPSSTIHAWPALLANSSRTVSGSTRNPITISACDWRCSKHSNTSAAKSPRVRVSAKRIIAMLGARAHVRGSHVAASEEPKNENAADTAA